MPLKYLDLFAGPVDRVAVAIARLQQFEPPEGYWLGFSGGKDSVALRRLADLAHVRYEAHYSVTTIDPPELVNFIREQHPDVIRDRPRAPFLRLLVRRGFPTRQHRWCCRDLKEHGGTGRFVALGLRWAESPRRKHWPLVSSSPRRRRRVLNPMIDWTDDDVWSFIREQHLAFCSLYDEGRTRLGCIACPMQPPKGRRSDLDRWPKFEAAFRHAFRSLYATGRDSMRRWSDGDTMFDWWLHDLPAPDPDAPCLFGSPY